MLRIYPFQAVRPAPGLEARIASVPYDVVNTVEARSLAEGNPLSFLHVVRSEIDLPPDIDPYADTVYETARTTFDRFQQDGAMIREAEPIIYLYRQEWRGHWQVGVVCCCHVDDYEHDVIRKHEKTRKVKEDDRTRHILSVNANTGPVFMTYRDQPAIDSIVAADTAGAPLYDFVAVDDVRHTVWVAADSRPYVEAFAQVECAYVADGHHRAASAFRAARQRRDDNPNHTGEEEYNRFLVALLPAGQLRILPYNRIVRRADAREFDADGFLSLLRGIGSVRPTDTPSPEEPGTFGVYVGGAWRRLSLDPASIDRSDAIASLDVALLQERVLGPIFGIDDPRTDNRIDFVGGIRGVAYLKHLVDSGEAAVAFALNPTTVQQMMAVADAGLIMPPKSTWFEPKLRSGLLVHTLD